MAGYIELATIKAPVVADQKPFKKGMEEVKKEGRSTAQQLEKDFKESSKKMASSVDEATAKIKKGLKTTDEEAKKLTKSAVSIYKDGFGKSMKDVVNSLSQTKRALGDIDGKELEQATKRAMELRDTLGVKMSDTLKAAKREMQMYGSTADEAFDRVTKNIEANQQALERFQAKAEKIQSIGVAMTAGLTAPILAGGVAVTKMASDVESATATVVSQLGLTEDQGAATKESLESIYKDGFGEGMDDVAEAVKNVKLQLKNIPDDQITKVTESALILQDTLGQDMGESLRGINSLMVNFGLGADQAMDLYVRGVQTGLDKTGELGDNLAEYGQIWSQAGFNAKDMFAILDNGLKSGAYNLDKVNDFVKEFTISLSDGRIEENLDSFSKNTKSVFKEFKAGKKTSQDVFKSVIGDLEKTKNQQEKLTLASNIWSALGEDNAMKIIESLDDVNHTYDDTAGAMEKVKNQQNETFGARAKSLFRGAQTALLPLGETLLDLAEDYMPKVEDAVEKFTDVLEDLDEEDINRILKIGGFVAIAGPTTLGIGKVAGAVSNIASLFKASAPIVSAGTTTIGEFGSAAALAGGAEGAGGLLATLGGLAIPAVGAVTTIGAVTLAVKAGYDAYKDYQLEGGKWGTAVTEEQDKILTKSKELREDAMADVQAFQDGVVTSSDNIVKANQKVVDSMQAVIDKQYEQSQSNAEKVNDETAAQEIKKAAEDRKQLQEQEVASAQETVNKINAITKQASNEKRQMTTEEFAVVKGLYQDLGKDQLETVISDKGQLAKIEAQYLDESVSKNASTNLKRKQQLEDTLADTKKTYEEQRKIYEKEFADNPKLLSENLAKLDGDFKASTEGMIIKVANLGKKTGTTVADLAGYWQSYGYTVDEVNELIARSSNESAEEVEVSSETAQNSIMLAIGATGEWNSMDTHEKNLVVKGDQAELALYDSIDQLGMWDKYNADAKELGVDNAHAMYATLQAMGALDDFDKMPDVLHTLIAEGPAEMNIKDAQKALDDFDKLDPELKKLLGNNDSVMTQINAAREIIKAYNTNTQVDEKVLHASTNAWEVAQSANEALNSVHDRYVKVKVQNIMEGLNDPARVSPSHAKGTNYHPGGDMIVNDQKGPLYEERVTFPNGYSFIPVGRNVLLNAPRGTTVDTASETRALPRYEKGIGNSLPYDGYNVKFKSSNTSTTPEYFAGGKNFDNILQLLNSLLTQEKVIILNADNRQIAKGTWKYAEEFSKKHDNLVQRINGKKV